MKKFLAVYIGKLSQEEKAQKEISDEKKQEGMLEWGRWIEKHSDSVVDFGAPLGKTKRVSKDGIADHANSLTGYIIVEAESQEKAAEMFRNHPHFNVFPGDSIEVIECMEIPQN